MDTYAAGICGRKSEKWGADDEKENRSRLNGPLRDSILCSWNCASADAGYIYDIFRYSGRVFRVQKLEMR